MRGLWNEARIYHFQNSKGAVCFDLGDSSNTDLYLIQVKATYIKVPSGTVAVTLICKKILIKKT